MESICMKALGHKLPLPAEVGVASMAMRAITLETMPPTGLISQYGVCGSYVELEHYTDHYRSKINQAYLGGLALHRGSHV